MMTIRPLRSHFLFMIISSLVILMSLFNGAIAGDYATRNILGFSPDGRFFAFEQYGIQGGSGFPYADLLILDTKRNRWVKGVPFRTLLFDSQATLKQARTQSKKKAATLLSQMNIQPRGKSLLSNPVTELTSPHGALFLTQTDEVLGIKPYKLNLKTKNITDFKCRLTNNKTEGLSLSLTRLDKKLKTVYLAQEGTTHRLKRLRGCPSDYKIAEVLLFDPHNSSQVHKKQAVLVVLLHVIQQGFDGNDGRFLAISYNGALN